MIREGRGPGILLVHGGASPSSTWAPLEPLAARWTLLVVHRRGYPPSPPGRHDFDVDAADLAPLLESSPHVVAHSYGALGALLAAASEPRLVRSLTLIEPAIFHLLTDDPEVAHLRSIGEAVLSDGLAADAGVLREFLRVAGSPSIDDGPLPDQVANAVRRAHGGRPPSEARPRLDLLRRARVPSLVASGGHSVAIERVCDAAAAELGAERLVVAGAGHFVAGAPRFAEELERFLERASSRARHPERAAPAT